MTSHGSPVLILGAGPGVGASVARRAAASGSPVGLVARDPDRLDDLARSIGADRVATVAADLADGVQTERAIDRLVTELGEPGTVVFSPLPDVTRIRPVLDTTADDLRAALGLSLLGFAAVVQKVLPVMERRGAGAVVVTTGGAVVAPSPDRAVSAVTYAALAQYVDLLQQHAQHVAVHRISVVGPIGVDQLHHPDTVADTIHRAAAMPRSSVTVLR
jgi:NADP-dependent 3-hydroxy acid dehydrogenase YdfG